MTYVGRSVPRRDAAALVTGAARFLSDLKLPGLAHGRLLRSPLAHARVVRIDPARALAHAGVLDVLTPRDLERLGVRNRYRLNAVDDMHLLCEKAHFVGCPLAAVVAETPQAADDALALVEVELEPLPAVLDPEAALASGAPQVSEHVPGNVLGRHRAHAGDVEAALAAAEHVLRRRFRTPKQHAAPMETHQAQAAWDPVAERLTVWSSTQGAHGLQTAIAAALGLPMSQVRVVKPFVGGAFGHKLGLHSHEGLAAVAARRLGRPVRFALSREEEFATASRTASISDVELGLDRDGTLRAWRQRLLVDAGGHSVHAVAVLALAGSVAPGPYRWDAFEVDATAVLTNTTQNQAFRAVGNFEASYPRELALTLAARELGLDPWELRRRNLVEAPCETIGGLVLGSLAIDRCMDAVGWDELRSQRRPWRGVGVANTLHWSSCRFDADAQADSGAATVEMLADGSVKLLTDAADSGQGHATVLAQVAADELGVPIEHVTVVAADTDATPYGLGSWGSRTAVVHGTATARAAAMVREKLAAVAAHELEAAPDDIRLADGRAFVAGSPERGVRIRDLASAAHFGKSRLPPGMEAGNLVGAATYDTPTAFPGDSPDGRANLAVSYQASTHAAVVDVDPETGHVTLVDYVMADDLGRLLNPAIVRGQLLGAFVQSFGIFLGEGELFDDEGRPLNFDLVSYPLPTASTVPQLRPESVRPVESVDPAVPGGQKGAGEIGVVNPPAAIAAAIVDAIGIELTELPMTPERIAEALSLRRGRRAPA